MNYMHRHTLNPGKSVKSVSKVFASVFISDNPRSKILLRLSRFLAAIPA